MEKTIINGKEIEHGDVIFHTTTTKLDFLDRIRILFGSSIIIRSKLYTPYPEVHILASEANTHVERLFPSKNIGMMELNLNK